jgi:hypothetical protein
MNVTAHRSMVKASSPPPDPVPPTEPVDPDGPGPKPPPKIQSARPVLALVSQRPEVSPGQLVAMVAEFAGRMTELAEVEDLNLIVAGHVARFVDAVCSESPETAWCPPALGAEDLIAMGMQFEHCAAAASNPDLGRTFGDAAHALLIAGAARLG